MENTDYDRLLADAANSATSYDYFIDPTTQHRFALCCANLARFMPTLDVREMPHFFAQLGPRMAVAQTEQHHLQAAAATLENWDNAWTERLQAKPGIVCTFHTGAYRILCLLLAAKGIDLALLLATDVLREQGPLFEQAHRTIGEGGGRLLLIDAESAGCAIAMRRALDKGYQLLVYLDGNTGAGASGNVRNLLKLDFMESQLLVRQGIAHIARRSGVPIYPAICTRPTWGQIRIDLHDPLIAASHADTMAQLYGLLEQVLYKAPYEWEGWLYLHPLSTAKKWPWLSRICPALKPKDLWPMMLGNRHFALHALEGRALEIGTSTYRRLVGYQRERMGFG